MDTFAEYIIQEMESRGITGWETEVKLDAFARKKNWDVVHMVDGKPRVAISLKSILRNLAGTVPNRTDDLIGEVADLQMRYPEVVTGYLVIMDVAVTDHDPNPLEWANKMDQRLNEISGRKPPFWGRGTLEASDVIKAKLQGYETPELITTNQEMEVFFETIEEQYEERYRNSGQQTLSD
jgi:hypothetical protein